MGHGALGMQRCVCFPDLPRAGMSPGAPLFVDAWACRLPGAGGFCVDVQPSPRGSAAGDNADPGVCPVVATTAQVAAAGPQLQATGQV